ncbi:hypothetical protein [Terrimonas pollutisoli]|uniref:hypothetical protein n=1 Tax=Terrimonas pollutisoli TaxID=3034147 RepID=UPI0023ED922E|nr:hypothetical protein [Terrimonas sp. H1YJ31]
MKNTFINPRNLAIAIATVLSFGFTSPAKANDEKKNEKKTIPVELKYLGNIENKPVFQLTLSSADENEFTIVVRDEYNTVLYRDNLSGNTSKKFLLNTEELTGVGVQFEITGKKSFKTVTYEVNKSSRLVEDVVVNKL